VFLFDEPLSNLDAALRVQMRVELSRLHKELKTTMIYVTHDQVEAMTLAHRIVVLNRGAIEQVGTPMEVYHSPVNRFVAGFIGSPKMNFIDGQLLRSGGAETRVTLHQGTVATVTAESGALAPGAKLTLGVRPEHLLASPDPGPDTVESQVQFAEHLGDTTYLHIQLSGGGDTLTVRTDPDNPLDIGDTAHLTLPARKCYLFDESGRTLPRAG